MTGQQRLTTGRLTFRLLIDFTALGIGFWNLLADHGGWVQVDIACLLVFAGGTFADIWNWKDPSPRFTLVRRDRP